MEVCPTGDGNNPEGKYEIHINGDIAFALQQYWQVTGMLR
jgi:trehalose/maltose hydrolase-like predicted phosphorylase